MLGVFAKCGQFSVIWNPEKSPSGKLFSLFYLMAWSGRGGVWPRNSAEPLVSSPATHGRWLFPSRLPPPFPPDSVQEVSRCPEQQGWSASCLLSFDLPGLSPACEMCVMDGAENEVERRPSVYHFTELRGWDGGRGRETGVDAGGGDARVLTHRLWLVQAA